jgi:hypothetical protein
MDCFTAFAMTSLFMERCIAPRQSMTSECMDCRALAYPEFIEGLAVTAFFKARP